MHSSYRATVEHAIAMGAWCDTAMKRMRAVQMKQKQRQTCSLQSHAHKRSSVCAAASALKKPSEEESKRNDTVTVDRQVEKGETLFQVPAEHCTSAADAGTIPGLDGGNLQLDEASAIALLVCHGSVKAYPGFLQSIMGDGKFADPPVLWPEAQKAELLAGSKALQEVRSAEEQIRSDYACIERALGEQNRLDLLPSFSDFLFGCAVVFCFGWVLESAGYTLVLAPGLEMLDRAPLLPADKQLANVTVDYDPDEGACVVTAMRAIEADEAVVALDTSALPIERALALRGRLPYRPGGDEALGQSEFAADSTEYVAELVEADPLLQAKKEVAATKELAPSQPFPVFGSQLPAQLYSFLRLARVQDANELTKVSLESDTPVSQLNEYEALQRLLADLRERLYSFPKPGTDEELRVAKRQDSSVRSEREVLAAELRYREKEVLRRAMQTVRDKLAPVRGVPTKEGTIEDPNADLNEIFDTLEAPFKAAKGFLDKLRPR